MVELVNSQWWRCIKLEPSEFRDELVVCKQLAGYTLVADGNGFQWGKYTVCQCFGGIDYDWVLTTNVEVFDASLSGEEVMQQKQDFLLIQVRVADERPQLECSRW